MSSSNCCFLTCIQVSQEAGQVVWYSHLFQNFPQFVVIHTVKHFGIVNEAELDVFLELSCFFCDPADVGNLISGSSAFSKSSLNIWKFSVHVLLKPSLENFNHYFASVWNECNCVVVWTFFVIAFLWDWIEDWPFPVLWNHGHIKAKTSLETESENLPCKSFVSRWEEHSWHCDSDSVNHSGAQGQSNGTYSQNSAQPERSRQGAEAAAS